MSCSPQFTVVIPVFNRPERVQKAVDSVLSQTYKPYAIAVVDDGSTDETPQILASYGNRITNLKNKTNRGVSSARNIGIKASATPWIALLDSDDLWTPQKLERDAAFIQTRPDFRLFQSQEIWYRNGVRVNPKKTQLQPEGWIFEKCLDKCLISPSCVVLHKSLFETFGYFDETLPVCEDYDMWIRLTRYIPCGLVKHPTVIKFRGHADQLSNKYEVMDRFRIKALKKLLSGEKNPYYSALIKKELDRKQSIVTKGTAKRKKYSLERGD